MLAPVPFRISTVPGRSLLRACSDLAATVRLLSGSLQEALGRALRPYVDGGSNDNSLARAKVLKMLVQRIEPMLLACRCHT